MKFLAIERPGLASRERMQSLVRDEADHLWALYRSGVVREFYFDAHHDAVLVLECMDEREANEVLSSLPLVREQQIRFEVMSLTPYTGFERLFRAKEERR